MTPNERIVPILIIALPLVFTCGFLVGTYPRAEPAATIPANYNPERADMAASLRACQETLALLARATNVAH